jgi:hypothetical protein
MQIILNIYGLKKIIREKVKYLLVVQSTYKCCMMDQLKCIFFQVRITDKLKKNMFKFINFIRKIFLIYKII